MAAKRGRCRGARAREDRPRSGARGSEPDEVGRGCEASEEKPVDRVGSATGEEDEAREPEIVQVLHHGLEPCDRGVEKPKEAGPETRGSRESPTQKTE
jgi:hypothetical protein